jgi:HPt (histidine-containing phosphotransfer) domain-containing protein
LSELSESQRRQLEALRQAYEAELPEKVTGIAQAAATVARGQWDAAGVRELHQLVHRLAGSSAIWGFTAVSRAAGELEEIVLAALDGPRRPPDLPTRVSRLIGELQEAVPAAPPSGPPPRATS